MASGGFMGGLSEGLNNGLSLYMQNKYYGGLNDYRDRLAATKEEQAAAKAERGGGKGVNFDEFDKNVLPIFGGGKPANFADKMKPAPMGNSAAGLGPSTLPDIGTLSSGGPAALGSLASTQRPPVPDPDEDLPVRQRIVKGIMSGNLANDPDKLSAIHAAAVMSGVGKEVTPWLEGLYGAKKTGLFDAAMDLKRGNIDGAMENLKRGGIALEDRPVKVNPDDPNSGQWKVNIPGTGEQVIDLDHWATSVMDPEKYAKYLNDRQDVATKGRVADAQIKNYNASATESLAGAGLKGAQARVARSEGGLGSISKLPAPAATAEWLVKNGVHDNYKDAFNAVKTLNDKSPSAARASLIEAAMKNGSTIGEAAKEVDDFLSGGETPAPSGTTRKYNTKTGRIE